jgi:phosphopentomutase
VGRGRRFIEIIVNFNKKIMSVTELQQKLIDKISTTNDVGLLEDIYSFIGIDEEVGKFYSLSDKQISSIEQSQQQIKDGNYFTNDDVNKEIDEWLEK